MKIKEGLVAAYRKAMREMRKGDVCLKAVEEKAGEVRKEDQNKIYEYRIYVKVYRVL